MGTKTDKKPNRLIGRIVLLAGGLKTSPLASACGGIVLNLPMGSAGNLFDHWLRVFREVDDLIAPDAKCLICVRPEHARSMKFGTSAVKPHREVVPDRSPYRGPAGVLRDATGDLPPDSVILVAEAARVVRAPLRPAIESHFERGSDATVGVNPDGSPAGVFVFQAGCLGLVPPVGFMDIKEQLLPKLVSGNRLVHVWRFPAPGLKSCRTRADFLSATLVTEAGQTEDESSAAASPGPAVVGIGALLDPTAYVAHSVIGAGARVEAGAVLVRSIVIGSSVVAAGASFSDAVITPGGVHADRD